MSGNVLILMYRKCFLLAPLIWPALPVLGVIVFAPKFAAFALVGLAMLPMGAGNDRLEYSLPVSARQICVAQLLLTLLFRWSPSALWLLLSAPAADPDVLGFTPATVTAMCFVVAMFPDLSARWLRWLPLPLRVMSGFLIGTVGFTILVVTPHVPVGPIVWWLCALCVLAVCSQLYDPPRVPAVFAVPIVESVRPEAVAEDDNAYEFPIGGGLSWRDFARMLAASLGRTQLMVAGISTLLMGINSQQLFLGLSMVSQNLLAPVGRIAWPWVFPLRPSARFALNLVSPTLVALAMLVMHELPIRTFKLLEGGAPLPRDSVGSWYGSPSRLPLTYWAERRDDSPVQLRAPWGELARADTTSAFGTHYFNPYSVNRTSSARFQDWQRQRMTRVVYGKEVSAAELSQGSLAARATGAWRMIVLQGALLLSWLLFVACVSAAHPSFSYVIGSAPIVLMVSELVRGTQRGEVLIPLIQRWLLALDASMSSGIFVITLAAVPVGVMLGTLWYVTARGTFSRQLRYATIASGVTK